MNVCGIAGIVRRGGLRPEWLPAMADALAHRGPDGQGTVAFRPFQRDGDAWEAGLAHRRLAVFDPTESGAQPMRSRSGRTTLVLNGEIYNHPELRRRLPGFPWRTATDTEVLVELLEREGRGALAHANGMFAFAAWDAEARRLWIGRDRLGVKPVYYRADKDGIAFASELRALFAGPSFPRRLDPEAFSAYLDFGFVPSPLSALEGVAKLPPGQILEWCEGRVTLAPWWRLPGAERREAPAGWREVLYLRLVEAVRLQLRSDVPVGCFLSGGVDSALLAALALRERGELTTFSLAFPDTPAFDESPRARRTAARLGTHHVEVPLLARDVAGEVPRLLEGVDEPFADSSLIPVSVLSRGARERVTVALSGDGADELFAGYRRYRAEHWLARWHRVPAPARRALLEPALRRLPADRSSRLGEMVRKARRVLAVDGLSETERHFALTRLLGDAEKLCVAPALLDRPDAALALLGRHREREGGCDPLDRKLRVDLTLGLPDDMLTKVDRASMRHGLEVRVPYLDHRLVEYVAGLPSERKLRGGRSKAALLDVFGAFVPPDVRRRAKRGFDAPLSSWLRGPLRELVHDGLGRERLRRQGLFDADRVGHLMAEHDTRRADHGWRIWSLLVWSDWSHRHGVA